MVKRAKLTLEADPVESDPAAPADVPPVAQADPKVTVAGAPQPPEKKSGIFKAVLWAGLTIASIVIFKRKIF